MYFARQTSFCIAVISLLSYPAFAAKFQIKPNTTVIGHVRTIQTERSTNFAALARKYDLGYDEIVAANTAINPFKVPAGSVLILPTQYILPNAAHRGLVVNLPEKRLYFFRNKTVFTFPIGIGRLGWATPIGHMHIIGKMKNPPWYVPASIRAEQAKFGNFLPKVMPAGPKNPLGQYALRLSKSNYLIHGTHEPEGVGSRVSGGCLRMYPEDIEQLHQLVPIGTTVNIVNQPIKTANIHNTFWLESHPPLTQSQDDKNIRDGVDMNLAMSLSEAQHYSHDLLTTHNIEPISNEWLNLVIAVSSGIPVIVGHSL